MQKEKVIRRQKDFSRLLRERKAAHGDKIKWEKGKKGRLKVKGLS